MTVSVEILRKAIRHLPDDLTLQIRCCIDDPPEIKYYPVRELAVRNKKLYLDYDHE
jgi:hypothetical protein